MPIYQASKQVTKFAISGVLAVMVDFFVYFAISQFLDLNVSKGLSFCSGMFVTYNLNKYWTWRQRDKNNKRFGKFVGLYLAAMLVNIFANGYFIGLLSDSEAVFSIRDQFGVLNHFFTIKVDKILAFLIATVISATLTFLGQKFWLFKVKD